LRELYVEGVVRREAKEEEEGEWQEWAEGGVNEGEERESGVEARKQRREGRTKSEEEERGVEATKRRGWRQEVEGGRTGRGTRPELQRPLVQILVVVANIQARTLKVEVERVEGGREGWEGKE
jgi:hypothetical protein